MTIDIILGVLVLILSVVVHETAHGYAAYALGDPTAKLAGRLTLNPIKHLDILGSFIVPLATFLLGGIIFGWAKPVPYNPYNLKGKYGDVWVALAGPVSNLFLAGVFGIGIRLGGGALSPVALSVLLMIVGINVVLAVFNLIPIPPLDGSKVLLAFLPYSYENKVRVFFERYGLIIVLLLIGVLWRLILPVIGVLITIFTGVGF